MSSSLKQRISSPLEAGTSILDSQNLPWHLTQALEYASKRLNRKALHITLLVVQNEYQLPSCSNMLPPGATRISSSVTSPASASASVDFRSPPSRFASPVAGLRSLVRRGTNISLASNSTTATSDSRNSLETSDSPRRWPLTPGSPVPRTPRTPMTPHTPASIITNSTNTSTSTSSWASAGAANRFRFGIRLIYTTPLDAKTEKALRSTIRKAERKFGTGTGWLPGATSASAYGLNADLVRRSMLQNEVLFSSEGLTLLGLDRLYTFKSALAAYARTTLPPSSLSAPISPGDSTRIEDAVDELRRLVLANSRRQLAKADLHRSYEWIGVSASALGDVERMYRRAYGRVDRISAFEDTTPSPTASAPEMNNTTQTEKETETGQPPASPRTPKTPVLKLKLQTSFPKPVARRPVAVRPVPVRSMVAEEGHVIELAIKIGHDNDNDNDNDNDDNDGDLTARPQQMPGMPFWKSLNEVMQGDAGSRASNLSRLSRQSQAAQRLGPLTPNGYDDISPITRGEWGFLFSGDTWKGTRTAAVETC